MAKYVKHNSNYIKTVKHQFLKEGSTIFERDWVTIGSQFNFGPGKIPYYRDGNFIFTTSPTPFYQKKHKNGVTVATWTYEDVKDASPTVNKIQLDEHSEDIRNYAYYGSCVELVRVSIENIIKMFPGNITSSNEDLGVYKNTQTCACEQDSIVYVSLNENDYWTLNNPFGINVYLKDVNLDPYDNPLRYLSYSFDKYQVSTNGFCDLTDITKYKSVTRRMYEKVADPCTKLVKEQVASVTLDKNSSKEITLESDEYYIKLNGEKKANWVDECHHEGDAIAFTLSQNAKQIEFKEDGSIVLILSDDSEFPIGECTDDSTEIEFYTEKEIKVTYISYQMFDDKEYIETYKEDGWVESTCYMDYWLPKTGDSPEKNAETDFLNECENERVRYSYLDEGHDKNQAVYTVTINDSIEIEGYIYNRQVIPLVKYKNFVLQPKEEVIEEYFDGLEGLEKQLLTRKTRPFFSNRFVTPIEYDLGYLYYKRTYTWPSSGYCIDISSTQYIDFVTKLSNTAELLDELWTDNLWRRMTHEAIKNYDWTYTREFEDGEEEDNVNGGERMHKVINVIGRVFDDVKRSIDVIKRNNRITYNADRNTPNALISDKLELLGWDIYSTIPSYKVKVEQGNQEQSMLDNTDYTETKIVSASEDRLENVEKWYPTLESSNMTFADVDVDFMRKLLLSSKRIFETKGTRHCIDMIMGMFGYGNMDEENPNYTITEQYFYAVPKDYDSKGEDEKESFGDKIVRLNKYAKDKELLYEEDASGIPVASFLLEDKTYLIPFYNQKKVYDGDFCFQSKGGWFYDKTEDGDIEEPNPYNWTETLSYLHVVSQVKDLLNVHPSSVEDGDIFYVVNVNDYIEFTEEQIYSNFFVLKNDFNPEEFDSWKNLNLKLEEETENDNNVSETEEQDEDAEDREYVKKALYLDSIIPYTIGNNPHVGYGHYDMGAEYFEYMRHPFKYSTDNRLFSEIEDQTTAESIEFEIKGQDEEEKGDRDVKIKIFADEVEEKTIQNYCEFTELKYRTYKLDSIKDLTKEKYYLNSKVIYFKNNIDNKFYKKYFRDVILKYLMQVIPSTAILVLDNFVLEEIEEEEPSKIYTVYFLASDGMTQIYPPQHVKEGETAENPDGGKWCLCPGGTTGVNVNTKPITEDTYFMKCDEDPEPEPELIYFSVTFKEPNGDIYDVKTVVEGDTVSNPDGKEWNIGSYQCEESDLEKFVFSTPITSDIELYRIIRYTVSWYETEEDTRPLSEPVLWQCEVRKEGKWYLKGKLDEGAVDFPYQIKNDTDFVKLPKYSVRFFKPSADTEEFVLDESMTQNVYHGETASNPGGNWSKGIYSTESTLVQFDFSEVITENIDLYKIEYCTVTFYESEEDQNPKSESVLWGAEIGVEEGTEWYECNKELDGVVEFPHNVYRDECFVKLGEHIVEWVDNNEILDPPQFTVHFKENENAQEDLYNEDVELGNKVKPEGELANFTWYILGDNDRNRVDFNGDGYVVNRELTFVKLPINTVVWKDGE